MIDGSSLAAERVGLLVTIGLPNGQKKNPDNFFRILVECKISFGIIIIIKKNINNVIKHIYMYK